MAKHMEIAGKTQVGQGRAAAACMVFLLASTHAVHAQEALLRIGGRGIETVELTKSRLAELPSRQVSASEQDGSQSVYQCVQVSELMRLARIPQGRDFRGEWLKRTLTVRAVDGYEAVFALPELDPDYTQARAALCYLKNGSAVPASEGPLRLAIPGEKRHSRWVRQVVEFRVND